MQLKKYQTRTLKILSDFLTDAKIIGNEKAFEKHRDAQGYNPDYQPLRNLEDVRGRALYLLATADRWRKNFDRYASDKIGGRKFY